MINTCFFKPCKFLHLNGITYKLLELIVLESRPVFKVIKVFKVRVIVVLMFSFLPAFQNCCCIHNI